ncbi:hypothetical protein MB02_03870 [Croceicoccus estronivorus]|nr:hypothetical protein MB02_03870 [Croceicoccus estronivorus]
MMGVLAGARIRRGRQFILAATVSASAIVAGGFAFPEPAAAQSSTERRIDVDIPAQDLNSALLQFTQRAGLQIVYTDEKVAGRRSSAVKGRFTPVEALSRLLVGTGLTFRFTGENRVMLKPAPESADGAIQLGPVRIEASSPSGVSVFAGTTSDPIATENSTSYTTPEASILKSATALKDIPQSITVITRQQIEDQGITDIGAAIARAPGIYKFDQNSYVSDRDSVGTFFSRGYEIDTYMVDGVPRNALNYFGYGSMLSGSGAIYDRIEVLRGAAGLLVGQGGPGGTINLVRKMPTLDRQLHLALSAGSWNNYRAEADLGGPLTRSGGLRARIVGAYQDRERFWQVTDSTSSLAYGVLEQELSDTLIRLGGRFERYREYAPEARQFLLDYIPERSRLYSSDWGFRKSDETEVFLNVIHNLAARWTLELAGSHREYDGDQLLYGFNSVSSTRLQGRKREYTTDGLDLYLRGAFTAFGHDHDLTLGLNLAREKAFGRRFDYYFQDVALDPVTFDPRTTLPLTDEISALIAEGRGQPATEIEAKSKGLYGKLDFTIAEPLTLVLGARISWYDYSEMLLEEPSAAVLLDGKVEGQFSPYVGLIYEINSRWSAYASYTDIFRQQFGNWTRDGTPAAHLLGKNYEIGLKGELVHGRLNVALAAYRVDLENSLLSEVPPFDQTCPGNPTGGGCVVAAGQQRTQGFDAEVSGELLPGWQLAAGYTYTHTEILKADADVGSPFSKTPAHMFRLLTSYDLGGDLSGLAIGGSLRAQSSEEFGDQAFLLDFGIPAASLAQKGFVLADAFLRYELDDNFELTANLNNIFDKSYFQNGASLFRNQYGEPRNVLITLRATY